MTSTVQHPPRDFRAFILIAFAVVLFVNGTLIGWGYWLRAQQGYVTLSDPVVENTSTALCPGSVLDYTFVLGVSRPAHIELKTSVQKLTAGARISYARLQEFEFTEPTTLEVTRHWVVPPSYSEPVSGQEVPWAPGNYEQITVANVLGRSEVSEIRVPFSIKSSCP